MENHTGIKLASCTVDVPYKGAGNVIRQNQVPFDVFKEEAIYKAVPQLPEAERRKANLPETLVFFFEEGRLRSPRKTDGNFHVIEDIVAKLQDAKALAGISGD